MYFEPDAVETAAHQIIGGERRAGGQSHGVASPSRQTLVREIGWASPAQMDEAVAAARAAFPGWAGLAPRERADILRRFADAVDAHAGEIARLEVLVSSRLYGEAIARDVKVVSGVLRYYAEWADKLEGSVTATPSQSLSMTVHEPHGVVAAVSPWNFPVILAAWKFAPALAAGNTVVLKPSGLDPETWPTLNATFSGILIHHGGCHEAQTVRRRADRLRSASGGRRHVG